ncbi:diguanylate cyclase [candidate division FCPU426 bacterium]|nr:diguanylate cyclase [candidate division FCPU426 bacterium]
MAETILVAEDDPSILELIQVILETKGYNIFWSKDGEETLRMAKETKPDLILMDVMMPRLNGYEVAHLLKENLELKDISIIFLTAKDEPDNKVVGLRLGGNDYITKPFDIYELIARIEAALRIRSIPGPLHRDDRRLAELSLADPLTGVYNQNYFLERFVEEIERARKYCYPIACVIIDLDRFQNINEKFGRIQGDQVLQRMAILLKKSNRVVDMIGRYGPDQFVIQLTQTDLGGAKVVAERFQNQVSRSRLVQLDANYQVTISIGISAFPGLRIGNREELLKSAWEALQEAKKRGGNTLECTPVAI